MTTPPRGNDPHSAEQEAEQGYDEYGRPLGRRPATTGEMDDHPPLRPPHLRGLSPEMAERNRPGGRKQKKKRQEPQGNGWFRNPFARPKPEPEEPANPWVSAASEAQPSRTSLGSSTETPVPPPHRREQQQDEQSGGQGNGWFQNPFAKKKPAGGSAGGGGSRPGAQVSTAQMWAGPRRAILFRRILAVLVVVLLGFLVININRKVDRTTVDRMIGQKVKTARETFPAGDAVMWAAPLIKAFGTYDEKHSDDRKQALEPYAINGLDPELGWNGSGSQTVIDMVVSSDVQKLSAYRAIVNATIQIQDGSWRCISVPVMSRTKGGSHGFGLIANPVYRPCAGLTTPPASADHNDQNDAGLSQQLESGLLPQYLAAWARGDQQSLSRYILPGTTSFGLGGAFTGSGEDGRPQVTDTYVPVAASGTDPDRRIVTFTVTFQGIDGRSAQTSTYQVPVRKEGSQWFIAADPTPAVGNDGAGGDSVPAHRPTRGNGDLYPHKKAPYPPKPSASGSPSPSNTSGKH